MANFLVIRDLSEAKRISLRKIASKVGISESALQTLIRNGSTKTTTLEKIAEILEVPVGVFFDETPNRSITQKGNANFIANSHNIQISECESKLELAQNKIANLEALLEEKERTIQILMKK
jgi:transcriptional regulator with XRE-family HTH domain